MIQLNILASTTYVLHTLHCAKTVADDEDAEDEDDDKDEEAKTPTADKTTESKKIPKDVVALMMREDFFLSKKELKAKVRCQME